MMDAAIVSRAHDLDIAAVAVQLGAELRNSGSPCPGCGGTDRFSVDTRKNLFFCRASGMGGDPVDLVRHVHGCDFGKAVQYLTGEAAFPERRKPVETSDEYRQKARERGYRIWREGYQPGDHVREYFRIRCLPTPTWRVRTIREARSIPYWHWSKQRKRFQVIHEGPAMLAAITGPDGRFIGCHRTWLDPTRSSGKAEIFDPETGEQLSAKKVEGSMKGGRIVLREAEGEAVLGEGIESVLSWDAMHGTGQALWCGVSLVNIAGRAEGTVKHPLTGRKVGNDVPRDGGLDGLGRAVRLLADADSDPFTTRVDMERARRRLNAVGVEWPPDGSDWNDVLRDRPARLPEMVTAPQQQSAGG